MQTKNSMCIIAIHTIAINHIFPRQNLTCKISICSYPISMEWNGQVVSEKVAWFQYETDNSCNSNVFEVAQKMVQKHFPGIVLCLKFHT